MQELEGGMSGICQNVVVSTGKVIFRFLVAERQKVSNVPQLSLPLQKCDKTLQELEWSSLTRCKLQFVRRESCQKWLTMKEMQNEMSTFPTKSLHTLL